MPLSHDARWLRYLLPPLLGTLAALLLFWLMVRLIAAPRHDGEALQPLGNVEIVAPPPRRDEPPDTQLAQAPAAPPDAPPSLARPELPSLPAAAMAAAPLDVGPISVPVTLGVNGLSITGSSAFGGFAGKGAGNGGGNGSGGAGIGSGQGFKGKPLVPLSTARPQMPDWACKQKIRGWVEVVFTVMPNGRVRDVRLVDAEPKGVFEAAAVDSISNWIYEASDSAREVKQRVDMLPEECVYNWKQ